MNQNGPKSISSEIERPSLEEVREACLSAKSDDEVFNIVRNFHSTTNEGRDKFLRLLLEHRPEVQKRITNELLGKG